MKVADKNIPFYFIWTSTNKFSRLSLYIYKYVFLNCIIHHFHITLSCSKYLHIYSQHSELTGVSLHNSLPPYNINSTDELILREVFKKLSKHLYGIFQAIYLSASLGQLPDKIIIYGMFDTGRALPEEVEQSINNIEQQVQTEIKNSKKG